MPQDLDKTTPLPLAPLSAASASDDLQFTATLEGIVNGKPIELHGAGKISESTGSTNGTYQLLSIPSGFDPALLSAVLVTGYPNASASGLNAHNPFCGRSYKYQRELKFHDGSTLVLQARCELSKNTLTSHFKLEGQVRTPRLKHVEPLVESWQPSGTGGIKGRFVIAWQTEAAQFVSAEAVSEYDVGGFGDGSLLHRYIAIEPQVEANTLRLQQRALLFHTLPVPSNQ